MSSERPRYYILEGTRLVAVPLKRWVKWFEQADRRVKYDHIGDMEISTVFLGIDHRFFGDGPPLVFETMIFGGPLDDYQTRASTYEEALQQHEEALRRAKAKWRGH